MVTNFGVITMALALNSTPQKSFILFKQAKVKNEDYNAIIKQQTQLKNDHAILSTYTQMESLNIIPDAATLPLVIKACTRLNAVDRGKRLHYCIRDTNLIKDVRVGTALVDFYGKCGCLGDACKVFDEMCEKDLVSWNAMVNGFAGCGYYVEAILSVIQMQKEGLRPNSRTMVALLTCQGVLNLRIGKEIHGYCLRNGLFESDPHVGTALIVFYVDHDVNVSRLVFDLMAAKNVVSWNAMINGYFDIKDCFNALKLFETMVTNGVEFDLLTILLIIQACAEFGCLKLGKQIHAMATKFKYSNDLFIANALLNMYSEIGNLELAREVFDTISAHDVAMWNSMLSSYMEYGYYEEANTLFVRMRKEGIREDGRTVVIMLDLCKKLANCLKVGKSLHALAIKNGMRLDSSLGNALLSMYTERNAVESVKKIFYEMSNVDIVSYNTLILALACNNLKGEAWELFGMMCESKVKPNSYTVISILACCDDKTCLNTGKSIHGFVIKQGIEMNQSLNTSLIDMYMNCGDEATARNIFDSYPNRDLISWNALIASYVKTNNADKALLLFNEMISEVEPNSVTILNILSSCTHVVSLPLGQCLHGYITRRESSLGFNLSLANAIITMYARCGNIKNAERIFKSLPRRNICSWNAIITGYGMHGRGYDAIQAFEQMLEDDFQPNGVTFISLLSACSHSGLIEKGLQVFHSMVQDFDMTPKLAHYGCVVDLLGRKGCINEAKEFVKSMPIEPDASVWRALLSASKLHADINEAKTISEELVELEPMNPGNYILISNIYAAAGLWPEVRKIRAWLKEKGLQKPSGFSWIVIRNQVHSFTAGSKSHPMSNKIYENLSSLLSSIREAGYVPNFSCLFRDEED